METITNTATAKQIAYIRTLADERDMTGSPLGDAVEAGLLDDLLARADKAMASNFISALLAMPRKAVEPKPEAVEAPEGMHRVDGVIYKVQRAVHGSGKVYAKKLVEDADAASGWTFTYAPGATRNLSEGTLLTLDEAKVFGALYGTCAVCARTLTNEASIAAGIGPVCASKF